VKPYYADELVTLYHGDCREVLGQVREVDAVVMDPPYGETSLEWDRWIPGLPGLLLDSLAPGGSMWCFGSMRMLFEHLAEFAAWRFVQDVVWEKHNGSGFAADRFRRVHEHATHWVPDGVPWAQVYKLPQFTNDATARIMRRKQRPPHTGHVEASSYVSHDGGPRLMRSVIQVRSEHGRALHPTQKPLGILLPLLRYSVPPGGIVLDPTAGAGSTLVAARSLGLRAIGIEADERYCGSAATRLSQGEFDLDGAA
jgi:site-specific DNA-methyltransferase (adenine-specific)